MKSKSIHLHRRQSLLAGCAGIFCWLGSVFSADAAEVRFPTASVEFSEGTGIAYIPLSRNSTLAGEQVRIQTSDGTALAGVDYQPVDEVYIFQQGETDLSIAVRVFDNAAPQADRTFSVSLSEPVGIDLGTPATATVTILDNDDLSGAGRGAAGQRLVQGTFAVDTQANGSIVLGGSFDTFNGLPNRNLVRLLPDEALDPSFDVGDGPNDSVVAVAIEEDGRMLIAGEFTEVDGTARERIARLNGDGSLDDLFHPAADALVESLELMSNGQILLAGAFRTVAGATRSDVAILNGDGSVDEGFAAVTPQSFVGHVARRTGDHILLGGEVDYRVSDANVTNALMRFHLTGVRDTGFQVSVGDIFFNRVTGLAVQPDGKIVMVGLFPRVNGVDSSCVARLNEDGSHDDTFDVGSGANGWVFRVSLQADGKILLGGFFTSMDGVPMPGVARLNTDGSVDLGFDPGAGADDVVYTARQIGDGTILLTGGFTSFDGFDRFRFARLDADGSLIREPVTISDPSLVLGPELTMTVTVEPGRVFRLIETSDFSGREFVLTNRTARRIVELSVPASGASGFFSVEQGF